MAKKVVRRRTTRTRRTEPRKVRVLMIGAGQMANMVHYPSLKSFKDIEIVGVCDMDPERVTTTCDKFKIPKNRRFVTEGFDDYRKIVEKTEGLFRDAGGMKHHRRLPLPVEEGYEHWRDCLPRFEEELAIAEVEGIQGLLKKRAGPVMSKGPLSGRR